MARFVYLVRHGATAINTERPYRLQGVGLDEPLSSLGVLQAERARDLLRPIKLAAIFTSPLQRARQTAEIIAQPHGLSVEYVDALRECDVGAWEGKSWRQIEREDPVRYHLFQDDPARHGYPGGESFRDVEQRVVPAVAQILADYPTQNLAIVWHNTVGRVYLAHLLGLGPSRAKRIVLSNGGISVLRERHGDLHVYTINTCFHLADL